MKSTGGRGNDVLVDRPRWIANLAPSSLTIVGSVSEPTVLHSVVLFLRAAGLLSRVGWWLVQVDALATSRDSGNMHEATRRILSVILQKIEGFQEGNRSVLVCATNRQQVSSWS